MKTVSFKVSKADSDLIHKIVQRAVADSFIRRDQVMEATMDLTACHANGTPLRLAELLAADDANFGHDFYGIRKHISRTTGEIGGCFMPRFAQPEAVTA